MIKIVRKLTTTRPSNNQSAGNPVGLLASSYIPFRASSFFHYRAKQDSLILVLPTTFSYCFRGSHLLRVDWRCWEISSISSSLTGFELGAQVRVPSALTLLLSRSFYFPFFWGGFFRWRQNKSSCYERTFLLSQGDLFSAVRICSYRLERVESVRMWSTLFRN